MMGWLDWLKPAPAPAPAAREDDDQVVHAYDAFQEAFERTVGHEGAYSADPTDRGNWTSGQVGVGVMKGTKFGISAASYSGLDIISLTLDDAHAIYRRDFWNGPGLDQLPPRLAREVFDAAVNSGPRAAIIWLQAALGVLQDGRIGPETVAAARAASDHSAVVARLSGKRLMSMTDMATWDHHGRGWARRIARNLMS